MFPGLGPVVHPPISLKFFEWKFSVSSAHGWVILSFLLAGLWYIYTHARVSENKADFAAQGGQHIKKCLNLIRIVHNL